MWLFGVEIFAQRVLKWLVLHCRMLPSEMFAVFVAYLAPYTWGLCLFFYSFQCEAYVCHIESFQVMAKSVAALGKCDSCQVGLSGHRLKLQLQKKVLGDLS